MNYYNFAAVNTSYDCNAYGAGQYDQTNCINTETSATPGDSLANTGSPVVLSLLGGIILISIGIAVLVISRRKRQKSSSY